jgi:triacylglycerol esterase/lipase EstA (alpha/beta hydrolase family)
MKKLVLFIHGLGGTAEGTWQRFPELIREDPELTELYDIRTFEYSSGAIGSKPSLAISSVILKTEIESRYAAYSDIALIAHSQGGLVARYYIAERLNSGQPLCVSRLLTFATPHQGSGFASLLKRVPFASQQAEDLDPNSQFLHALGVAWGQAKADRRVLTRYVGAADDAIVGPVSAMGLWNPAYQVVSGVGHIAIVKPATTESTSFRVAKKFLLEESIQPGGVEADYRAPLLRLNHVDPVHITRFIYSARVLPFFGREAEINILGDFLGNTEQRFRWTVMHGSGGVGKSRIALELCLAIRNEWHAGFLPQDGQEPDWGRWQPLLPTLIVIDYAARDTDRVGRILRALAGRGVADSTLRLAAPVRILLVERTGEGDWLDKIVGVGTTKAQINADRTPNLQLATISDPWPIFEFVFNQAKKPLPDKNETLAALDQIDGERRPLFAYFIADAIVSGHDIRHFDADRLLDQVIDRNRQAYWKPAGATAKEERLLALATMVGGLPVGALAVITEKLLPSWDVDRHPAIFLAMTGRESGENIAPLEPDIVGEHFTLVCLAQGNLSNEDRARFCGLAWRINPLSMAQFMLFAHRDLGSHAMLGWIRKPPLSEWRPQVVWLAAGVNLMRDLPSRDPAAARALLEDMRGLAGQHDEAELWELWAKAAVNLTIDLRSRDPDAARALLEDMRGVAAQRDYAPLWKEWAKAAFLLTTDLRLRDPAAARALLDNMRDVAARRDEAPLWELWARATYNLTHDLGSCDPATARALLDDMRGVAAQRDEAPLWELWAKAGINLTSALGSSDLAATRALLEDIRGVAVQRDEAPLWDSWAQSAVNLAYSFGSRDPAAARALLDDMHGVAVQRDSGQLWKWWAKAVNNLKHDLESSDPATAEALLEELLRDFVQLGGLVQK